MYVPSSVVRDRFRTYVYAAIAVPCRRFRYDTGGTRFGGTGEMYCGAHSWFLCQASSEYINFKTFFQQLIVHLPILLNGRIQCRTQHCIFDTNIFYFDTLYTYIS